MRAGELHIVIEDATAQATRGYLDEVFEVFHKHFSADGDDGGEHRDLTSHHQIGFQAQPDEGEEEAA